METRISSTRSCLQGSGTRLGDRLASSLSFDETSLPESEEDQRTLGFAKRVDRRSMIALETERLSVTSSRDAQGLECTWDLER